MAKLGPIADILLFIDGTLPSPYEAALNSLGLSFQRFSEEAPFNDAVANADPSSHLVIVDSSFWAHHFDELDAFVRAGGRSLLQFEEANASRARTFVENELFVFYPVRFDSIHLSGDTTTLAWPTWPGRTYQVQHSPHLSPSNWSALGSPIVGDGLIRTATDTAMDAGRFYRLVVLP